MPTSDEPKEKPTPVAKKNRVNLAPTLEEDETPPASPEKVSVELSTSPPHETKVRQISMRVRGLKWEDKSGPEQSTETSSFSDVAHMADAEKSDVVLEPAADISGEMDPEQTQIVHEPPPETPLLAMQTPELHASEDTEMVNSRARSDTMNSDVDDPDKPLKRKLGDRMLSNITDVAFVQAGVEPSKRSRDDGGEADDNPREKKRPSPPPEEEQAIEDVESSETPAPAPESANAHAPEPKTVCFESVVSNLQLIK